MEGRLKETEGEREKEDVRKGDMKGERHNSREGQ